MLSHKNNQFCFKGKTFNSANYAALNERTLRGGRGSVQQWLHQGGHGEAFVPPPHWRLCSPIRRKNCQNQPFWANFCPSEMHFSPSMPPTKKSGTATGVHGGVSENFEWGSGI